MDSCSAFEKQPADAKVGCLCQLQNANEAYFRKQEPEQPAENVRANSEPRDAAASVQFAAPCQPVGATAMSR